MIVNEWLLIALACLIVLLAGCGIVRNKNITQFDWIATESAPSGYPMKIIRGELFYHGQEGSRYIPSGGIIYTGWGGAISTHIGNDELYPLPDKLKITFFSYTENQFYSGEFDLPYEKLLAIFQAGVKENKKFPRYREIMVGIAPGGVVAVWLTGFKTTEIFFGNAEKINLEFGNVLGLRFSNKQEEDSFIYKQLVNVLKQDELDSLKNNGVPFGLWSRYRNEYKWNFKSRNPINFKEDVIGIRYLKGDTERIKFPFESDLISNLKPLPRRISVIPKFMDKNIPYVIYFDEFELMNAFEKLGANGELVTIEFDAAMPRENSRFRVFNDKETIELVKTNVSDR